MTAGWLTRFGPWRARLGQAGALLALSSLLGLAFNTSNPLGVRWSELAPARSTETARQPTPAAPTGSVPASTLPTAAVLPSTNRAARALPPLPPLPPPRSSTGLVRFPPVTAQAASRTTPPLARSPVPPPAFRSPVSVHWNEIKPLAEAGSVLLVDSRIKPAYDAGHIPGAVHLAENSPPGQLEAFRSQHGTNQYLVVYCSSTSCSLSYRLAHKLARDYGFAKVDYMTGGYVEYQRETALAAEGGPTSSNPPPVPAVRAEEQVPLLPAPTTGTPTP